MTGRYPAVARACLVLDWGLVAAWAFYLAGPDALGLLPLAREAPAYGLFTAAFFALHFVLIATGIIALFVVIIEVHSGRAVRGFPAVLAALALPIASFLYFAARYLALVRRWLEPS